MVRNVSLDLGIENEDESATSSTDNVGKGTLEEGLGSFVLHDLVEAIHGAGVLNISTLEARLHHQPTADGIKRVRGNTGSDSDDLSEHPHGENISSFWVGEKEGLSGIEDTEVAGAVGNNTNDGDTETTVKSSDTIGTSGLGEAVDEASELTGIAGTDISGEAGTSEIEGVDDAKGSSTGSTTGGHVTHEELEGFLLLVVGVEDLLVQVLEGEVKGLGGEISHDVGQVTAPE